MLNVIKSKSVPMNDAMSLNCNFLTSLSSHTLLLVLFLLIFFIDCYLVNFGLCSKLSLVPGFIYLPNFQIYRFLTFYLINYNFILLQLDILGYILFEKLVNRRWNLAEQVKFFIISTWIPGLLCLVYYYVKFANTKTEADINSTRICGSSAFVAAVFVTLKQLSSETTFGRKAYFFQQYALLIYLSGMLFLSSFALIDEITFAYSLLGFLCGWTYLRFVQKHTDGLRGDHRHSFSFVCFFPPMFRRLLAFPVNCVYACVTAFRICPKLEQQYKVVSTSTFSKDLPNVLHSTMDRHKRIALDDLNTRLSKQSESVEAWPVLVGQLEPEEAGEESSPLATFTVQIENASDVL